MKSSVSIVTQDRSRGGGGREGRRVRKKNRERKANQRARSIPSGQWEAASHSNGRDRCCSVVRCRMERRGSPDLLCPGFVPLDYLVAGFTNTSLN